MRDELKQFLRRYALAMAVARLWNRARTRGRVLRGKRRAVWSRRIAAYLGAHELRMLQLGSGPHLRPGWLNTDLEPWLEGHVYLDATKPFPLPDRAFDRIFTEHMIEHVSYREGGAMLGECHRVLKAGGVLRVATPNLQSLVGLFSPAKTELQQQYVDRMSRMSFPTAAPDECFALNGMFYNWGHRFLYDPPTLQRLLESVGFGEVTQRSVGESPDPHLSGLESHGQQIGDAFNQLETMVFEARRP
jgi:predicted SAM-dependent methyltransferase